MGGGGDEGCARQSAATAARKRRHVRRAGRPRQQPAVASRSVPAADRSGGMGRDRARRHAARALVERAARRSLRRAARAQGEDRPARPRVRQSAVLAAVHERLGARRSASALRRVRSRALRRRPLVGAQRSHAGAVGRGLRARESRRVVAVFAGAVRGSQRPPARELLPLVQSALL